MSKIVSGIPFNCSDDGHGYASLSTSTYDWVEGKQLLMINGTHVVVYSKDADADRAFFRDILEFASVDAGHGWLIFALPTAEAAFHPAEGDDRHELYLMCDNLKNEMAVLTAKGVECAEVAEARWGSITKIRLPGGSEIGLYEPKHPRP